MGRPLRQSQGGIVYHVLNRRVLRLGLFDDRGDYLAFERVLAQAMLRPDAPELFTFCLMPNHWHLLVRPRRDGDLSAWMQWLTVTHTHRWQAHRKTAGSGPVYQGRFKSFPVADDPHFLTVARYVERNGLRARLCRLAQNWRYSGLWLRMAGTGTLTPAERDLAGRLCDWPVERPGPRKWLDQVNRPQTAAEVRAVEGSLKRGTPLGPPRWVDRVASTLGLESTLRPRGRPRKAAADHDKSS